MNPTHLEESGRISTALVFSSLFSARSITVRSLSCAHTRKHPYESVILCVAYFLAGQEICRDTRASVQDGRFAVAGHSSRISCRNHDANRYVTLPYTSLKRALALPRIMSCYLVGAAFFRTSIAALMHLSDSGAHRSAPVTPVTRKL